MMNLSTHKLAVMLLGLAVCVTGLYAQKEKKNADGPAYQFTIESSIPATPVKDQHRTGTCWSFATTSFIEAELLRTGNHIFKGFHYVSEAYMRAKTIFFMVHKEAVPASTAEKLGL